MISFIYFDVGGVIIDDFSGNNNWQQLRDELGIDASRNEQFKQLWKTYGTELNTTRDVETMLPILKNDFGIQIPSDYSLMEGFVKRFRANPTIWHLITKAQETVPTGLLTNMYPGMLTAIKQKGILPDARWNVIVDSSIELLEKPDHRFYELAEQRAGVNRSEILFIDNSNRHIQSAKDFGWQTFLYESADHEMSCYNLQKFLQNEGILE